MKKISSLILILMLVLTMVVPAMAEGTATITNNVTGHTFTAYQIFTGTLGAGKLADIKWGNGIDSAKFLAGLKADDIVKTDFANCETAEDVADVLSSYSNDSDQAKAVAAVAHKCKSSNGIALSETTEVPGGYYLIVDTTENMPQGEAFNLSLLQVSGNMTIGNKTGTVSMEKKVKDKNDTMDEAYGAWQDSADHDIGDVVPFKLEAKLPANLEDYNTYKMVFHDTLSAGFTYDEKSARVTVNGNAVEGNPFTYDAGDGSFTFTCENIKPYAGNNATVAIEYNATLNDKAVIGSEGNPNVAYLEYSNQPNVDGEGENGTGRTPDDKVIVFTYKTVVNKVDQDGKALAGAEFKLEKVLQDGSKKEIAVVKNTEGTTFEFKGLDDGTYILSETTTPEGYNSIEAITFTVAAVHSEEAAEPELISLSGTEVVADGEEGSLTMANNIAEGTLTTNIVNNFGATLPETGGMGTTVLYIGGAVLIAAALILLVAKKRTGASK